MILDHCIKLIKDHYGDRVAERSKVPLMNHIIEGLKILNLLQSDEYTKAAFAIHPLIQADSDLMNNVDKLINVPQNVVVLAMEYRNIANQSLPFHKKYYIDIKLSPLPQVNQMLAADKVQNRKDFMIHHYGVADNWKELDFYFDQWLKRLHIDTKYYNELTNIL